MIKSLLTISIIAVLLSSCNTSAMLYQYGESNYEPCPQCTKVEVTVENPYEQPMPFVVNGVTHVLNPGKKVKMEVPIENVFLVSFNGYEESFRVVSGWKYDLRPWMDHIYTVTN